MEHNIQQSLFFDIETTGLSADISAITVIGCCDMDGNVTQWFNEDGLSQKQILTDFLAFIQPYNTLITFNGKTFDLPFLTSKIKEFKINASFDQYEHLDLYQILKPYKKGEIVWAQYEEKFMTLMAQRNIEKHINLLQFEDGCLLCSEHLPHQCHRRLVIEYLKKHNSGQHITVDLY